ncbi:unnamed protein product, partial [Meganyctiphanes norvegica]
MLKIPLWETVNTNRSSFQGNKTSNGRYKYYGTTVFIDGFCVLVDEKYSLTMETLDGYPSKIIITMDGNPKFSTWKHSESKQENGTTRTDGDGELPEFAIIWVSSRTYMMRLTVYYECPIVSLPLQMPRYTCVCITVEVITVVILGILDFQRSLAPDFPMTSAVSREVSSSTRRPPRLGLWNYDSDVMSLYLTMGSLGFLFLGLHSGPVPSIVSKLLVLSYLLPTCCLLLPLPTSILMSLPVFSALLPLATIKYSIVTNLWYCAQVVFGGYQYARGVMRDYGLHSLLESEWVRLNVPNVLRTFWMIRVAQHIVLLLGEFMYVNGEYQSLLTLDLAAGYVIFKAVMTQGCETAVALLGMTSIVSYISHYIGILFQMVLLTEDDDERSMGTVCAILFFVLAEQSGLTVLEGEKRFVRLCRNFCLLFTAMLHFTHNMVNPVLMSLSASRNPALYRHARALIVCSVLVFFPLLLLWFLWTYYPLSTWLLAVSAFSIQVVVKTVVSLVIYGLFLVDAHSMTFWERLDDYVYYIRAFGNSVEFIFGILLFFNGAWIYFFESGGSIRALMMCVHAYFNIWCEARNGWIVFMKRRTAVNKINSLPEASQEQLQNHDDVCAICFQDLSSAKITKCNHYFHSVCLRKWLYVQDSCPLCHETLYKTDQPPAQEEAQPPEAAAAPEDHDRPPQQGDNDDGADRVYDAAQMADAAAAPQGGDNDGAGDKGEEYMRVSEVWGNNPNIDVILGEDMNRVVDGETTEREVVIDNEVGEALHHRNTQQNLEQDNLRTLEGQEVPQVWLGGNNDNQQMFVLRTRRSHRSPIIDQDIGQ